MGARSPLSQNGLKLDCATVSAWIGVVNAVPDETTHGGAEFNDVRIIQHAQLQVGSWNSFAERHLAALLEQIQINITRNDFD